MSNHLTEEDKERLLKEGILVLPNLNLQSWLLFNNCLKNSLGVSKLEHLHRVVTSDLNGRRLAAFSALNSLNGWEQAWFAMVAGYVVDLLGPDLLIQRKLNLSIQAPKDKSSTLGAHTDTLSGQSPYEIVSWIPFTEVPVKAGMFYFDRTTSSAMIEVMPEFEKKGLAALLKKFNKNKKYLIIKPNEIALFSGSIFHGNHPHTETVTRVSVNCRFKNVMSPEAKSPHALYQWESQAPSERGVGVFYKLLQLSPITTIGIEHDAVAGGVKF